MSRAAYWTIIAGGQPTAFRGRDREDLLPTLKQLQSKQPDAAIVWFERGKVFPTRDAALEDRRAPRERRPRDWRPGGDHRDPRAKYEQTREQKRARFKQLGRLRRERDEGNPKPRPSQGPDPDPFGDRIPRERSRGERPRGDGPRRPDAGKFKSGSGEGRAKTGGRGPGGGGRKPSGGGRGPGSRGPRGESRGPRGRKPGGGRGGSR